MQVSQIGCSTGYQQHKCHANIETTPPYLGRCLIHIHPLRSQVRLRQLDLVHQLRVRVWCVAEGEHPPAQTGQEPSAEGDEEPEGELYFRGGILSAILAKFQPNLIYVQVGGRLGMCVCALRFGMGDRGKVG